MAAYMDLCPGDRVYTIPETVVSLQPVADLDGYVRSGVLTTRLGATTSVRTVLLCAVVHTEEGCI